MTENDSVLGSCPQCGHEVREAWVMIEYETTEGEEGVWAECPNCETIVDPIHAKPK
nr:phage terminase large subunit family protein [Halorubrum ezzemoulense]